MKKNRKLNGPQIIGIALVGVFLLWNIVWGLNVLAVYLQYQSKLPVNELGGSRTLSKDGYHYSVKLPDYLSFTSNLSIVNIETHESLIVWPSILGKYTFGVRLMLSEDEDGSQNFFSHYEMYVDEDGKPISGMPGDQEVWVQKADTIHILFEMCEQVWNL